MFVVITKVPLKLNQTEKVRELFEKTNSALVQDQPDWMEAKFTVNRMENEVTVLAFWRDADSYKAFSASDKFRQAMSQFAPYFAAPPQVSINEILFEM